MTTTSARASSPGSKTKANSNSNSGSSPKARGGKPVRREDLPAARRGRRGRPDHRAPGPGPTAPLGEGLARLHQRDPPERRQHEALPGRQPLDDPTHPHGHGIPGPPLAHLPPGRGPGRPRPQGGEVHRDRLLEAGPRPGPGGRRRDRPQGGGQPGGTPVGEDGKPRTYPMLRSHRVFNVEQTEDCRIEPMPSPSPPSGNSTPNASPPMRPTSPPPPPGSPQPPRLPTASVNRSNRPPTEGPLLFGFPHCPHLSRNWAKYGPNGPFDTNQEAKTAPESKRHGFRLIYIYFV